jgi:thiol-disulfide isomerase/thioredoxin
MLPKTVSSILILMHISFLRPANGQVIRVGEMLPVKTVDKVLNVENHVLDLTKGRPALTIIDFWETNCSGCIKKFPAIDSMREKFKGRVQFIMVNSQSMDSTIKFFKKRAKLNYPALPFVTNDTLLNKLFPHKGVPYCVWLDSNLTVIGVSSGNLVNEYYIKSALAGKKLLPQKKKSGHDRIPALLNYEYEQQIQYSSIITRCITGYMETPSQEFKARMTGVSTKGSIEHLFKYAYSNGRINKFGEVLIFFATKDSQITKVPRPYNQDWYNMNCYSYSVILPKKLDAQKFVIMQEDLQRFFGYKVHHEKSLATCLVLETTGGGKYLKTCGGSFKNTFSRSSIYGDIKDSVRELKNGPFNLVLNGLRFWFKETRPNLYFVNNSGISPDERVDIKLTGEAVESLDIDVINKELAIYDLRIEIKKIEVEMVVVADE